MEPWSFYRGFGPVDLGVERRQPGVSEDYSVVPQVSHEKARAFLFSYLRHQEVAAVGDVARPVKGPVDVPN